MFGPRREELLIKAAEALADGSDPFSEHFLIQNNVRINECFNLSEDIALLIKSFLACPKEAQFAFILSGISASDKEKSSKISPEDIWRSYVMGHGQRRMKEITELLKDIK